MKRNAAFSALALLTACSSSFGALPNSQNAEQGYIGNPYSEDTGHYAGYEWAERTGGNCDGNSQSFNEGCEEYYRQIHNQ